MRKTERKKWKWSLGLALAVVVCLAMPMGVHAEGTDSVGSKGEFHSKATGAFAEKTGTLGKNDGIIWRYDEETKALVVTGSDELPENSDWKSPFLQIYLDFDIKKIVLDNCKLIGSVKCLFYELGVTEIDFLNFDTSAITDMTYMFAECYKLTSLDVSSFDTSAVSCMDGMFLRCRNLTSLDVSGFDTSKVTSMSGMFICGKLTNLDVSGFDTSKVMDMSGMFSGCSGLTSLNVSGFDTSKVTDMSGMFSGCSGLTSLDVSGFDTKAVTNMDSIFRNCSGLTSLDVSGFDTKTVTNMDSIFRNCNSLLSLDLSSWNFTTGYTLNMFRECYIQTLLAPKTIKSKILLQDVYVDEYGNEYTALCEENTGKKLTKIKNGIRSMEITPKDAELEPGGKIALTLTLYPEDAYNKVTWHSVDEKIATVDEKGVVTAHTFGDTTIDAVAYNDEEAGCWISIPKICDSIEELESQHNYENGYCITWIYTLKGAKNLTVTFDERTQLDSFDYLRIYNVDDNDDEKGWYYHNELSAKKLKIKGDTVKISLVSYDDSLFGDCQKTWGFKVTDVVGEFDTYQIIYDLNSGSNHADNPATGSSGQEIVLKAPTRSGCYKFAGWYTDAEYKNPIEAIPVGTREDIVLYAKWEAIEHSYDEGKVTKEPTCAAEGEKTYTCAVCGETKTETIAKTEKHSFDTGKVTKEPTCTAEGVKTYTCTLCKATKTEVLAKAPHDFEGKVTAATLTQDGRITGTCKVCGTTEGETVIYHPQKIALSATSFVYNGKTRKPAVKVTDTQGNEIAASNYQVAYGKGCKNVGKYKVTVTFQGNYQGTKALTFTINPAAVKLKSLTAGSKSLTVKWAKNTKQTSGYELQYSTSKSFAKKATKTVTIKKNTATSRKLTKLKAKKKYYVRIRTYKTVSGKKYYSAWSKAMSGTTKK